MTTNRNYGDASSSDVRPWSDLNHDLLLLVMMQLEVVDFLSFSGVCKSWRSVAYPNRNKFMASKPPMLMCLSPSGFFDLECSLEDYEGRKIKTTIFQSSYVGLTCGYFILIESKTGKYWLQNPFTGHEVHLPPPPCPFYSRFSTLVFSPSINRYVFFMLDKSDDHLWYYIAGEGEWNCVISIHRFNNLHAFKGKMYTVCSTRCLCELTFDLKPKLTLLKTKNFLDEDLHDAELLGSGENLYFLKKISEGGSYKVHKLDISKMEWVQFEDARDDNAFFLSEFSRGAAVKPDSWADPQSPHESFKVTNESGHKFFTAKQWYFPHKCLNVNLLDES